jgi:hypothetical protein
MFKAAGGEIHEPAEAIVPAFHNAICPWRTGEGAMQYERLYSDPSGETHFEQVPLKLDEADYRPPAPMVFVSHALQGSALQFVRLPSGWAGENICPPQRQFLICLDGQLEVRASDGKKRTFAPGHVVLMEDTSGRGHASHVKGGKDLVAAIVSLE